MKSLAISATVLGLLGAATPGLAAGPSDKDQPAVIGQPTSLIVQPQNITLVGPRAMQQVIVTGRYADGSVRDLTPFCTLTAEAGDLLTIGNGCFLEPKKDGTTNLVIQAGPQIVKVPVTVKDFDKPGPVSFRNDFIASLNVGGCNSGACHGTPKGKGEFRLSLRGYDPAADYLRLTRDVLGRRTNRLDPDASLILEKALGKVPHEGGQRFKPTAVPAQTIQRWLSEGLRDDPAPAVTRIDAFPDGRVLHAPAKYQQLSVRAHFADHTSRDVTRLTVFSSSDPTIADVDANGLVKISQAGEVAILCRYLETLYPVRLTYLEPRDVAWSRPPENNYVDKHVFSKLQLFGIRPSELCTDDEFVRRAYLDVCGILPTPEEARTFLDDRAADKRARLIDKLLDRPEYADFWALKWLDVLRGNRKTIQRKGVQAYQKWWRQRIEENAPFDVIVRDLLTASGSTFANPPANYFRVASDARFRNPQLEPKVLAENTAQLFLGVRLQCAQCHNHPTERWTQNDYYGWAAFFGWVRQKEDTVESFKTLFDRGATVIYSEHVSDYRWTADTMLGGMRTFQPKFMGGKIADLRRSRDPREVLARWLTDGGNRFFARSAVNRIWYHLNGRGIVEPVDDFRDSNPSANDPLLDALAKDFVAHQFDTKHLIRTILNSRTYQFSAQTNETNKDDHKYFSHAAVKLLSAEPLLDAICQATDVPEKFKDLPPGTRAVQLPDGEDYHAFLKEFGQPPRAQTCECERATDGNVAKALQLLNGPVVGGKVINGNNRLGKLLKARKADQEILEELYLATLSRRPTADEVKVSLDHIAKAGKDGRRQAWEDLQWTLLNVEEFRFRH
jgi:hypothetical protein